MEREPEQRTSYLGRTVTRRQAIKVGGIAVAGLAFSKPLIETVRPKPAFASYTGTNGQPSIEWVEDEIRVNVPDGATSVTVTAVLCDVSGDDPAVPFDAEISFLSVLNADGIGLASQTVSPDPASWGTGDHHECKTITFTIDFTGAFGSGDKLKLEYEAEANGAAPAASPRLTITLQ